MEDNLTEKELDKEERQLRIDNEDKREDAQRKMAWYALFGMLTYPIIIIVVEYFGLSKSATILGDMAGTYFVSVAGIVGSFFVKEGLIKKKNQDV